MKTILLDENLPVALRHSLAEFEVVTVQFQGWSGKQNGELISLIEGKFDVFLTGDKNLRYQQRIETWASPSVELRSPVWTRWCRIWGKSRQRSAARPPANTYKFESHREVESWTIPVAFSPSVR